jgi:hypothetical protein
MCGENRSTWRKNMLSRLNRGLENEACPLGLLEMKKKPTGIYMGKPIE